MTLQDERLANKPDAYDADVVMQAACQVHPIPTTHLSRWVLVLLCAIGFLSMDLAEPTHRAHFHKGAIADMHMACGDSAYNHSSTPSMNPGHWSSGSYHCGVPHFGFCFWA